MKLTNKLNLPQPLVDAVKNDGYTKSGADISVTELLLPPMLRALQVKHEEELEEDVSDRIFSLLGQVVHGVLERAEKTGIAERRLSVEVNGWKISGGMDRYDSKNGLLQDYKLTTIYKTKGGKLPEEWVKQLNIYAEILRQNNEEVKQLEIVAIYRDWSKGAAEREADYPKRQVEIIEVPLIDSKEVVQYIEDRVKVHQAASRATNIEKEVEPCTPEERWERGECWAIVKIGQKKASKLCYSKEEADMYLDNYGSQYELQHRPGISTRCKDYCSVAKFCKFYQNKLKGEK